MRRAKRTAVRWIAIENARLGGPAVLAASLLLAGLACKSNSSGASGTFAGTGATASPATGAGPVANASGVPTGASGTAAPSGASGQGVNVAQSSHGGNGSGGGAQAVKSGSAGSSNVASGGPSEWTMIAHDTLGTYNNAAETVLSKENAASLSVAWQANMGSNVYGAPLQIGDKIYASSSAGVKAFDAASGMMLWDNPTGTTGSLAYDAGTLYVYALTSIVALDASTGQQKWSQMPKDSPGGDGSSSPVIAGNAILIGGSSGGSEVAFGGFMGFLAALDKTTGQGIWTSYTVPSGAAGASLWSSAAADVSAGLAFGTTGNNHGPPATDSSDAFIAFDLMTGEIKWKNQRTKDDTWNGAAGTSDSSPPDADFGANPVLYEAMVDGAMTKLVSSGQKTGQAHAVQRADGKLVWTRQLCMGHNSRDGKFGIFVNGAWSGKNMLFACNNEGTSSLLGLDGATGDIAWMTPLSGEVYGRISAANGVGFVGAGANLVVFDTDSGKIIKMVPSNGGTVAGTISIANGRVAYGEGLTWANGVAGQTLWVLKVQ